MTAQILSSSYNSLVLPSRKTNLREGKRREKWEYSRKGEFVQSTLYTYMELPQCNTIVLLMYTNSKYDKTIKKESMLQNGKRLNEVVVT
jgi:hypothetical protein